MADSLASLFQQMGLGPGSQHLDDMPDVILIQIMRQLQGADLGPLCATSRRLRDLAQAHGVWRDVCLQQWPHAEHLIPAYGGDWAGMFAGRSSLPASLPVLADRSRALRLAWEEGRPTSPASPADAAPASRGVAAGDGGAVSAGDEFLRGAFSIGACCRAQPELALTAEARSHVEDLVWVVRERPDVMCEAVRRAGGVLNEFDFWGGGQVDWSNWYDVPWRRTAVQFALDAASSASGGPGHAPEELLLRVQELDMGIRHASEEAGGLALPRPPGVPPGHWWYSPWCNTGGGFDTC